MSRRRVVSLVPSATETLLALGADVVGCTKFCNQPGIPTVGGTKNPDIEAIVALRPDLVVVDTEENRRVDADAMIDRGLTMEITAVRAVGDAAAVVRQLAVAAGVDASRVDDAPVEGQRDRATAFVPIWRRPWMTINGDTYGASLLRSLGVRLVSEAAAGPYPTVELVDIAALNPDLVLVPSEPYSFTDAHLAELRTSFPAARVVPVDGEDLFWWGIRTPGAQRRLRAAIE